MVSNTNIHISFIFLLTVTTLCSPVVGWQPTPNYQGSKLFGICMRWHVHVINGLSSNAQPLFLHCQSRDDDLGDHTLYIGGDFNFKFGRKIFGPKTWFTCDMHWNTKHRHVDVFKQDEEGQLCCIDGNSCYWRAQDDGIYFSPNNIVWVKRYEWV